MKCPKCSAETAVIDSREAPANAVRRRRECEACGERMTTYERNETDDLATVFGDRLMQIREISLMNIFREPSQESA